MNMVLDWSARGMNVRSSEMPRNIVRSRRRSGRRR